MFIERTKYSGEPTYLCDKCGAKLKYRPMRLALQIYDKRMGHHPIKHYDLCEYCYDIFDRWIKKKK